jgi:hypothetical protein
MSTGWAQRLSGAVKLLAALLFAASALRLGTVGLSRALGGEGAPARQSAGAAASDQNLSRVPRRLREDRSRPTASASTRPAARAKPSAKPGPGRLVSMMLVVSAGPARSEVYVRGRRVGSTPYLGDVTCPEGAELVIEVVPHRGMPLRFTRRCQAGATLRIE